MSDRIYWTQEQEKWFLAAHSRSSPNYIYQKWAGNFIRWQEKWKGGDPRGEKRQFRFTDHLPHDESGNPSLFFLAAFMFLSTTENKTKWCKEGRRERKFGMQTHPRLPCHPKPKLCDTTNITYLVFDSWYMKFLFHSNLRQCNSFPLSPSYVIITYLVILMFELMWVTSYNS